MSLHSNHIDRSVDVTKPIPTGTRLQSLRSGVVFVVVEDYDPNNIRRNATIKAALPNRLSWPIHIPVDRMEQEFENISDEEGV